MISKTPTVLIVDDKQDVAELISFLCKDFGFPTLIANTIDEAVDLHEQCDIILLDLFLDETRGPDTVDALFAKVDDKPIIAMSAHYDKDTALSLISTHVEDYIDKDVLIGSNSILEGIILRTIHRYYRDSTKKLKRYIALVKAVREV